jgi:hypothetical protein
VWEINLATGYEITISLDQFSLDGDGCVLSAYLISACETDPLAFCDSPEDLCIGDKTCELARGDLQSWIMNYFQDTGAGKTVWLIFDTNDTCVGTYEFTASFAPMKSL